MRSGLAAMLALLAATGVATRNAHAQARTSPPARTAASVEDGMATFYGPGLHGRRTASGERFDRDALVAAHPTLPFGTHVRVTHLGSGATVVLRVIDRGPSAAQRAKGYVIDVSEAAAELLGFRQEGTARVRVEVVNPERRAP